VRFASDMCMALEPSPVAAQQITVAHLLDSCTELFFPLFVTLLCCSLHTGTVHDRRFETPLCGPSFAGTGTG
jgi:hypothetical protein